MIRKLLTAAEVSAVTRLDPDTLYYRASKGIRPHSFKLGGRRVWEESEVESYIEDEKRKAEQLREAGASRLSVLLGVLLLTVSLSLAVPTPADATVRVNLINSHGYGAAGLAGLHESRTFTAAAPLHVAWTVQCPANLSTTFDLTVYVGTWAYRHARTHVGTASGVARGGWLLVPGRYEISWFLTSPRCRFAVTAWQYLPGL